MNIEMIFDHSPRMEAMIDGISSDFHFSPVIFGLSAELLGKSVNHLLIAYEGESFCLPLCSHQELPSWESHRIHALCSKSP
jgi:hypothetical protein